MYYTTSRDMKSLALSILILIQAGKATIKKSLEPDVVFTS
jgi:hypothetical protein